MRIIEVFNLMAERKIEEGTKLIVSGGFEEFEYEYKKRHLNFVDEDLDDLDERFNIDENFLNREVELIPPKEKKYLVKLNMRGLREDFAYLNYTKSRNCVVIHGKVDCATYKTHFTKDELQSIQPVREFLEDMEGKFELVEVADNEND